MSSGGRIALFIIPWSLLTFFNNENKSTQK
jgi:hypothetical protein